MYFLIDLEIFIQPAFFVMSFHTILELAQPSQLRIGYPRRCELSRKALDSADDLEYLIDLSRPQRRYLSAAVGSQLQQPFRSEQFEGFAERGPRNSKIFAQSRFENCHARSKITADN